MDRIDQLRRFIDAQPDDPFPRYALALERKVRGDAPGAAAELQALLARKPEDLAATYHKAVARLVARVEAVLRRRRTGDRARGRRGQGRADG